MLRRTLSLINLLLLLGIVAMTYVAAQRANIVVDMTVDSRFTLSAQSREVIALAQRNGRPIQILGFYLPQDVIQREIDDQYWQLYSSLSQGLISRRYVDPNAEPAFFAPYQTAFSQGIYVYVGYLGADGLIDQTTIIPVSTDSGQEEDMTEAISQLLALGQFVVYFERSLETLDPADNQQQGMSILNNILRTNGIVTQPLSLQDLVARNQEIPADASALVIARPGRRMTATERAMLNRYLIQGGRVFIAADYLPIPEAFLDEADPFARDLWHSFGLGLRDALVIDPSASGQTALEVLSAVTFEDSELTQNINKPNDPSSVTQFRLARPVVIDPQSPVRNGAVIQTSAQAWGERNLADVIQRTQYAYDEGDLKGPLTLVGWAENPANGARVVLVGDGDFLMNGQVRQPQGNATLFLNSIGWLTGFAQQVAFQPRVYTTTPILFTSGQQLDAVAFITLIFMPGMMLAGAGLAYLRRWRQ